MNTTIVGNSKSIYVDGLFYGESGIGRYTSSIIRMFLKRNFTVATAVPYSKREVFLNEYANLSENLKVYFVNYSKFSLKGFLHLSFLLKKLEKESAVFIFPHINMPIYVPERSIVVIHDLRPFTPFWDRGKIKRYILYRLYSRAMKKAKAVVCISRTVQEELESIFPKYSKKIHVVKNTYESSLVEIDIGSKSNVHGSYILFVGNRKWYKNIGGLIKAFQLIKDEISHNLLILGKGESDSDEYDALTRELNLERRVKHIKNADDNTLAALYKHADLFVMPSFYEGFGFPPFEAVYFGCPAIFSDIPIFRELWGEAGLYFDPHKPEDIAEKIFTVLVNKDFRDKLLEKQKRVLENFTEDKMAEKFIQVIEKVLST
ncbi:MAG: glycosyltransferase family 1 protein [Thermodesulfovibrio sp.]|nr:glycosyltransferase family 1 protein [Thermodesulfovibrio sp.]